MSVKETNKAERPLLAGSDGPAVQCPAGSHWDEDLRQCVDNNTGDFVAAVYLTEDSDAAGKS